MRKLLSLMTVMAVALQLMAAPVDVTTAKTKAEQYLAQKVYAGKYMAPAATQAKLIKTEMGEKAQTPVYYIFNTASTFVIVSGDDRAEEILAVGDKPLLLERIPKNMQVWLDGYKEQLDWLLTHPDAKVEKTTTFKSSALEKSVTGPLMTALWDQAAPYNNLCKFTYSGTTYTCVTGCPATSASMVLYFWKYPTEQVGPLPAYSSTLDIGGGGYWGNEVDFTYPSLPATTFDWDNMKDKYGTWYDDNGSSHSASYNSTQAEAISWLMRYVGQACNMGYSTSGSGATDPEILEACHTFGYTDAQLLTLNELVSSGWSGYTNGPAQYTDAQWNEWMLAELHAGRPIEYLAYDCSDSSQPAGHAFNVFGCDADGKYYVNWGWSGDSNGYCTLHNFTTATGATGQAGSYVFNYGEAMIIGIAPPAGAMGPQITVNPTSLEFEGYVGDTYTKTFTVTGANLEGDVTISKQGSNNITVSTTTITAANAANGVEVTVTYKPTNVGNASAVLTLSSDGADDVTLNVTGTAQAKVPTINVDPASLSFNANLTSTATKTFCCQRS